MESEDTEVLKDTKVENIHVGVEALSRTRQTVPELIAVVFQKKNDNLTNTIMIILLT